LSVAEEESAVPPWKFTRERYGGLRGALRRLRPSSFRGRIVFSTVVLMAGVMVCVGVGIQVLLALTARRDIDGVLADRADAVIAIVDAATPADAAHVEVRAQSLDPGVMVYDEQGRLVAGSIEHEARDAADDLARVSSARDVDASDELRLRAVPFSTPGGQSGVVVVSQETAPYERSELYALIATCVIGLLVTVLAAAIARRVTSQALAPVTQMARRAAQWSEDDLTHRFDLGPADNELAQLGATLDQLLDRVAMAIRAEQRLTSELAHELRTPLTAVQGSADLALLRGVPDPETRGDLEQISASARYMGEVITTLVDLAHDHAAAGLASTCHVTDLVEDLRVMVPVGLELVDDTSTSTARIGGPRELVLRALAPLVENAVKHAQRTITIAAHDTSRTVQIRVGDDGTGVDHGATDWIFEVGESGSGGTGLGLGIARRLARALGGDVTLDDGMDGYSSDHPVGATFVLSVPRA
jgi:signal transduction histidine kinase